MVSDWRFDPNNPFEDAYEESTLGTLDTQQMSDIVHRKLLAIQKNPKDTQRLGVIANRQVYLALAGVEQMVGVIAIEPVVIAFTLDERKKLIQRVLVSKATGLIDDLEDDTMERLAAAFTSAIEHAILRANAPRRH